MGGFFPHPETKSESMIVSIPQLRNSVCRFEFMSFSILCLVFRLDSGFQRQGKKKAPSSGVSPQAPWKCPLLKHVKEGAPPGRALPHVPSYEIFPRIRNDDSCRIARWLVCSQRVLGVGYFSDATRNARQWCRL